MTLKDFIRSNRADLESAIKRTRDFVPHQASCDCPLSRTDHTHSGEGVTAEEIRQWILNDEGLYLWARSEGVRI